MNEPRQAAERVRALFNEKAATWSAKYGASGALAPRRERFAAALKALVPPPARVLDLGAGTGDLAAHLGTLGYKVTACDVAERMIEDGRRAHGERVSAWVRLDPDWRELPFAPGAFDAVVASSVLEYVPDPAAVLRACARVLGPGGRLLVTVPNPRHRVRRVEAAARLALPALEPLAKLVAPVVPQVASHLSYLRLSKNRLTAAAWRRLAVRAGFDARDDEREDEALMLLMLARRAEPEGADARDGVIVAIDAVGARYGGAATVVLGLVTAALRDPGLRRVVLFTSPARERRFTLPESDRLRVVERPWADHSAVGRLAWLRVGLAAAARMHGADVILALGGGGMAADDIPGVTFVQQSLVFSREALTRLPAMARARLRVVRAATARSCRGARLVIVQTPTMRRWVSEGFGVPPERILVVPPCAHLAEVLPGDPSLAPMLAVAADRRLLYVGHVGAYKNLDVVLAALPAMRRRHPGLTLFVTCGADDAIAAREGVVALGLLGPGAVAAAYRLATALVLPSLVETVGLPMLEAAASGTPVLAADRPYAHDVMGDAAVFFDPLDPTAFARVAGDLLSDAERRAELGRRGLALAAARARAEPDARAIAACVAVARGERPDGLYEAP